MVVVYCRGGIAMVVVIVRALKADSAEETLRSFNTAMEMGVALRANLLRGVLNQCAKAGLMSDCMRVVMEMKGGLLSGWTELLHRTPRVLAAGGGVGGLRDSGLLHNVSRGHVVFSIERVFLCPQRQGTSSQDADVCVARAWLTLFTPLNYIWSNACSLGGCQKAARSSLQVCFSGSIFQRVFVCFHAELWSLLERITVFLKLRLGVRQGIGLDQGKPYIASARSFCHRS